MGLKERLAPRNHRHVMPTVPAFSGPPQDNDLPKVSPTSMLMAAAEAQRSMPSSGNPELQTGKAHPRKKIRVVR